MTRYKKLLTNLIGLSLIATSLCHDDGCIARCRSSDTTCWPSQSELSTFSSSLTGNVYSSAQSQDFKDAIKMINPRIERSPGMIINVANLEDVKKCVRFANDHNLLLAVKSTGHSFIGRSSVEKGLVINMVDMKAISITPNATARSAEGEVKVESGNTWGRVYEEVDTVNKVVLGGSDPGVGMGGYTQGGGHSPLSRSLGLAVDSLLEVDLVTAAGEHWTVNEDGIVIHFDNDSSTTSDDTDLFWAIKGGGGGSFGVIVSFTFKLHAPPSGITYAYIIYPLWRQSSYDPGQKVIKSFFKQSKTMDNKWGGYMLFNNAPSYLGSTVDFGWLTFVLIHYGAKTIQVDNEIETFVITIKEDAGVDPTVISVKENATFWGYESGVETDKNPLRLNLYIMNVLTDDATDYDAFTDLLTKHSGSHPDGGVLHGCTATLLGGAMRTSTTRTSISPYFKTALHSVSCYLAWDKAEAQLTESVPQTGGQFGNDMLEYGKAVYFNEPTECLPGWKKNFWGEENYALLLAAKKKYDPRNLFVCFHCVGCDRKEETTPNILCPEYLSEPCTRSVGYNLYPTILVAVLSLCIAVAQPFHS